MNPRFSMTTARADDYHKDEKFKKDRVQRLRAKVAGNP
jgi:hypothetical protein